MRKIYSLLICVALAVLLVALTGCDKLLSGFTNPPAQSSNNGQSDVPDTDEFTVSFDSNGGTEVEPQHVKNGRRAKMPTKPKKDGHTFEGWYCDDVKWNFAKNEITEDVLLVAKWTVNENVIIFNSNGALGEMENLKCLFGQSINLTQNQFVNPGYSFLGWSTTRNGAVEYVDGALYEMGDDETNELYAVWSTDDYAITYEVYGGNNSVNTKYSFTLNDLPISLKAPYKDGCVFAGWYTSSDFTGDAITKITEPESIQLYAKFIEGTSGLEYKVHSDYVEVKGYNGSDTNVIIPEYYAGGLPVSVIGESAFWKCKSIESVSFSQRILTIKRNAFKECTSLSSVEMSQNLVNLEYGAFYGCSSLKSIEIPKRVEKIGISAFEGCTLLENVTLTDTVSTIGESAFKDCTSLKSIVIPNGVKIVENAAFHNCSSATTLVIGQGLEGIGDEAFKGCVLIEEVVIPNSVTAVGESLFSGCTALHTVTISNEMTIINSYTFENCVALKTVNMGENVEEIYDYAFSGCDAIEEFDFTGKIERIGKYAFAGCDALVSIILGDNIKAIGDYSFSNCAQLKNITFGNGLTAIPTYAFGGCDSLTEVVVPNGVTSLGKHAFAYCEGLTRIVIPQSVTEIIERALYSCPVLESIEVSEENQSYKSMDGSLYSKNGKTLIQYATGKKDTAFTIPSDVTAIGDRAFYGCTYLNEVTIGKNVASIGRYAFDSCTGITSINLENPNGWWYTSKANATSGTSISGNEMENPQSAAGYLAQNYTNYYWKRG